MKAPFQRRSVQLLGFCSIAQVSQTTGRPCSIRKSFRSRSAQPFLALLVASFVGLEARADASSGLADYAMESIDSKQRVESLIRDWFASLENPAIDSKQSSSFLSETSFEFRSKDEAVQSRAEYLASISDLRASRPHTEYQLDSIEIESVEPDLYRARFQFNRRFLDEAGIPHVARREHIWMIRSESNAAPVILQIEERPLLFFPGTGPQVVCY
jgi:hypothetical protein